LGMLVGLIFIWIFTKKPAIPAGSSKKKVNDKK